VGVSGAIRKDRREILMSLGDSMRGEPLPSNPKRVDDLRTALERALPDSPVEGARHDEPRWFGP
jgi:hypothetical protein